MKKVLSLVLVLTLVLGSFSMAFAAPANDVVDTEYEDAVDRLGQLGVLTGYPDGTFKPANTITRAEFAAVVVRSKGLEAAAQAAQGATTFSDVPASNWASGYINIASKMGFVKGMGDGTFAPNAPVTYEQAVTMVVRALGYEPAAVARGGYPYGYLIVANEIELLESVKGTQGAPAHRGLVALLVDNALEIPLMVQVSYGDRVEHIVSGSRDGVAEKTLLSELNFTKVVGRVTEINEAKNLIRIGDKSLKVDEGFDFQEALGLRLRAWYNNLDKLVLYTKLDTPVFDAVEYDKGDLYLYGEDKNFDLATDKDGKEIATLFLDGKKVDAKDFNADYAKVVLDSYGDIIWAQGITSLENIVVEKLDGNVVESYGYEELSLKNYTIVKEGKTISVDDLEKNDIVFYNSKVKFAVVYNNGIEGKIGKIYTDSFVFEGETYEDAYEAKYLDGNELNDLNSAVVNRIKTEDEKVTVFVDFYGKLVLVAGKLAAPTTSNNYFLVIDSRKYTDSRTGGDVYTLDVLNAEGKIVENDIKKSDVQTIVKDALNKPTGYALVDSDWETLIGIDDVTALTRVTDKKILKLTLNTSGKITGIKALGTPEAIGPAVADQLATDAKYVNSKLQLQGSAVVFRDDSAAKFADYAVSTWAKAEEEFTKVTKGQAYGENGKVVAIYAETTNAKSATTDYTGLVTEIKDLRGGKVSDVTIVVAGEKKVFTVETNSAQYNALTEDTILTVTVVNKTGEISAVNPANVVSNAKIDRTTPGSKTIITDKGTFYLENDAVIYENGTFTKLRFADLKSTDVVDVYRIAAGSSYANYVVKYTEEKAVEKEFTIDTMSVALVSGSGDTRTVTATVYAKDVVGVIANESVDRAGISVVDYSARRVSNISVSGNVITFDILFNTEDILAGDELDLGKGTIQFKIGNTIYTNKAGSIIIE